MKQTQTVTLYRNDQTKQFSISKRSDSDTKKLGEIVLKEASRGFTAAVIATGLTDDSAVVLKANLTHGMEVAGYSRVTREALEKGPVYA